MALANRHVLEAGSGADDETLKKCVSVFEETALSTLEHTPALWNAYGDMLLSHLVTCCKSSLVLNRRAVPRRVSSVNGSTF